MSRKDAGTAPEGHQAFRWKSAERIRRVFVSATLRSGRSNRSKYFKFCVNFVNFEERIAPLPELHRDGVQSPHFTPPRTRGKPPEMGGQDCGDDAAGRTPSASTTGNAMECSVVKVQEKMRQGRR